MAARGPYLLATIMVVLCLTVGVTGLQQRIWFCVVGDYELGTFGYASSSTANERRSESESGTGGVGQTQPLYTVHDIAGGQWYGTLTFSGLLAGLAGGALLFLASLILVVVRFGGSHLCASAGACCTCDPGESAKSKRRRSKEAQAQLRKARKQYWVSLWAFAAWVVVFSGAIFAWMEWQGAQGGIGQDLLLGLLVCVALWVFTHKLFLEGYTRLRRQKRRCQHGQKDTYELQRASRDVPERSGAGVFYHQEEDRMDDDYVGDSPLGGGPRDHGPD